MLCIISELRSLVFFCYREPLRDERRRVKVNYGLPRHSCVEPDKGIFLNYDLVFHFKLLFASGRSSVSLSSTKLTLEGLLIKRKGKGLRV